jgi:hypothetical protein
MTYLTRCMIGDDTKVISQQIEPSVLQKDGS